MGDQFLLLERLDPKAEMVYVSSFITWRPTTSLAEPAVDGNEIDHGLADPQMNQTKVWSAALNPAAKNLLVETDAALEVSDPEHDVIDFLDCERDHAAAMQTSVVMPNV